jgi:hypothetical protein
MAFSSITNLNGVFSAVEGGDSFVFPAHIHNQTFSDCFGLKGNTVMKAAGLSRSLNHATAVGGSLLVLSGPSGGVYRLGRSDDLGVTWDVYNFYDGATYDFTGFDGLMTTGDVIRIGPYNVSYSGAGYAASSLALGINLSAGFTADGSNLLAVFTSPEKVRQSTDKGLSWTDKSSPISSYSRVLVNTTGSTWLLYTTDGKVQTSTDDAATFSAPAAVSSFTELQFNTADPDALEISAGIKTAAGDIFLALRFPSRIGVVPSGYSEGGALVESMNIRGIFIYKSGDGGTTFKKCAMIPTYREDKVWLAEPSPGSLSVIYDPDLSGQPQILCVTFNCDEM